MTYPTKRNLDGVFYRVKRDCGWLNVCYSDLTQEERDKCTRTYSLTEMRNLANLMADALHRVGDSLNIVAAFDEKEIDRQSRGEF